MNHPSARVWLRLVFLIHILLSVAALDITYPKVGTIYPATGPDDVQWQSNDEEDPSDLAIYLATYNGQNLTSEQPCIVCSVSDGSTAITLTHPAPKGDSYTWMFYDNDVVIALGYNYVAESVHFQITSPTPTPSPSSSSTLSPAVAAAIGVGGTVLVLALAALVAYFGFYRRWRAKKRRETINAAPYVPDHPYAKHELDSKAGTFSSQDSNGHQRRIPDQKMASQHEMEVFPQTPHSAAVSSPSIASPSPGGELSAMGRHSRLPPWRGEMPVAPVRYEMQQDAQRVFPSELPGDSVRKEWS